MVQGKMVCRSIHAAFPSARTGMQARRAPGRKHRRPGSAGCLDNVLEKAKNTHRTQTECCSPGFETADIAWPGTIEALRKEIPLRPYFRNTRTSLTLFFCLLFVSCAAPSAAGEAVHQKPLFPVKVTHPVPEARQTFEEVRKLILDSYYSSEIDEASLYWAAIKGMLRHISPPKTPGLAKIWTEAEYEKQLEALTGQGVSLGIKSSFNAGDGSLTVSSLVPGSPAAELLRPLDRILRIGGQPLKGRPVNEIQKMLTGELDEKIALTVARDLRVFEVSLTFEKITVDNLQVTPVADQVALVRIKSFTAGLSKRLAPQLLQLKEDGIKGVIIDLRNNPGGVFIEAMRVAELFLTEKKVLLRTLQRENPVQTYVSANADPFHFVLAVLVNAKTASSAEILAGCLQDHQAGLVIGASTYGKGIFEKTFELENKMRVKFITGAMYSPRGKSWHGGGLTPDFLVVQDDKTLQSLDRMPAKDRFSKDVAAITAYKLLKFSGI
jgi:carboxyl-terminal processing protease